MRASPSLSCGLALELLLSISCQVIQAQSVAGAFALTGLDSIAGTMTLLRNGQVLFAGGGTTNAEIYDPPSATLSATGPMTTPRSGTTHVLLQDGRVLFAGGLVNNQPLTSAEIYNPASGTFTLTGTLPAAYAAMTAAPLPDGRVLIVGNQLTAKSLPQNQFSAIFDPTSGTFSSADPIPMLYPVATPLADGRILFVGVTLDQSNNVAFLYDPTTSSFRPTGSTAPFSIFPQNLGLVGVETKTDSFGMSLLANGDVLVVGGEDGNAAGDLGPRKTTEIYDPLTETFHQTASMPLAMASPSATTLPSGLVLITGAEGGVLYAPAVGQFISLGAPKNLGPAVALPDGTVLVGSSYLYVQSPYAVSAASFTSPMAAGSLATMFGVFGSSVYGPGLAQAQISAPNAQSPPTTLGGVTVLIRDSGGELWSAPLLYVSPTQINFQVPTGLAPGNAVIAADNANGGAGASLLVTDVAPGLFTLPKSTLAAAYAIRIESGGSQTILPAGAPISLDQRPVYLCLFGTGIRGLSSANGISASIGGVSATVSYAGPQGSIPGLDQVNVLIPPSLTGAGYVPVLLDVDSNHANPVLVNFK